MAAHVRTGNPASDCLGPVYCDDAGYGRRAAVTAFDRLPDWSGLWTAAGGGSFFNRGPEGVSPKLTPAAAAALKQGADLEARGISYDENLSECGPPGFPRWLVVPFLREFIVRPEQTWLSSETVNNVRRIYTDGRGHPPPDDRYRSTMAIPSVPGTGKNW